MTIHEVETRTGMTRANIRFYEKEGLLAPAREAGNHYRTYSESDVELLRKIRFFRLLGCSIPEIRQLQTGALSLSQALEDRKAALEQQREECALLIHLCSQVDPDATFDTFSLEHMEAEEQLWKSRGKAIISKDQKWFGLALIGSMVLTVLLGLSACKLLYMGGYARDEGFYAPAYFESGSWLLLLISFCFFWLELVACLNLNAGWKRVLYPLIILYLIFGLSICIGLPVFWHYVGFL